MRFPVECNSMDFNKKQFPCKCNSMEELSDRWIRNPQQVIKLRRRCPTARITAACSFRYDLRLIVSPGEEKDPRPNTKLLLSVIIKVYPSQNLILKKQYENVNLKKKPSAEHQGPLFYPSTSFADITNLA